MNLRALAFAAVLGIAAVGCSSTTYQVHSAADEGVEFKYRTFSFGADPAKLPKDFKPSNLTPEVKKKSEETLNLELGKLGYSVDDAAPDLEVLVASGQRENRFRSGKSYDTGILNDGTLIVEVWDTKAGDMIWRGAIEAHVDQSQDFDYTKLGAAITTMMQSFPKAVGQAPVAPPSQPNPG